MIENIKLENFKAFENESIGFKPLTFILGPNNSGKSSILASLRILTQTVESFDTNIPILLNGSLGDFGTFRDIAHGNHRGRKLAISIKVNASGSRRRHSFETIEVYLEYKFRSKRREVILKRFEMYGDENFIVRTEYSEETGKQVIQRIENKNIPSQLKTSVSRSLRFVNFLPSRTFLPLSESDSVAEYLGKKSVETVRNLSRYANDLNREFRQVEYVGAMRVPPSRTFLYSGESRARVGASGQNAANILALDNAKTGKQSKQIAKRIKNWLIKSEMASDIRIKSISDRHYEIKIQNSKSSEYQNFADVGFGHSQILPVLVGGYNLDSGGILMVEQPEIHLHPKAQAELGEYFTELYRDGIQSIVETHSEHLILRLQQKVIEKEINPEDIVFYYVQAESGSKKITELQLDEKGMFTTAWPEGFFPERLKESKKIAQLRYKMSIDE